MVTLISHSLKGLFIRPFQRTHSLKVLVKVWRPSEGASISTSTFLFKIPTKPDEFAVTTWYPCFTNFLQTVPFSHKFVNQKLCRFLQLPNSTYRLPRPTYTLWCIINKMESIFNSKCDTNSVWQHCYPMKYTIILPKTIL